MSETTDREQVLREMISDKWALADLHEDESTSIRWAVAEIDRLRARVAELEAAFAVSPRPRVDTDPPGAL